jgi:hypothetical protein
MREGDTGGANSWRSGAPARSDASSGARSYGRRPGPLFRSPALAFETATARYTPHDLRVTTGEFSPTRIAS